MSNITPTFALSVNPRYIYISERGVIAFHWSRRGRGIDITIGKTTLKFNAESDAWQYANANVPDLIGRLQRSDMLGYRAYAMRAEMMLKLGAAGFDALVQSMHQEILDIFDQGMRALGAVRVSKTTPKVICVAPSKGVSWHEVKARVQLPFHPEPVLLGIRCLPSPVEEKTWSVRMRTPGSSDINIMETQMRFDELVRNLSYQGITVKDVQNGTCLDL